MHGLAHITGGGFYDNVPRVVPDGLCVQVDPSAWTPLPIFDLIAARGGVEPAEMHRVFNMGIGLVVMAPRGLDLGALTDAVPIGEVGTGPRKVSLPF